MPIVVSQSVPQVPSTDATSPDGRIRATVMSDTAGVFIKVDYRSLLTQIGYEWPNPFQVTIWRQTPDGIVTAVRGAQNVLQYGAVVHAYDDEVTFGAQVLYWAEAPLADGINTVVTDKVAVLTWEPAGGFTQPGVWIKNLENPDFSAPARCVDWSGGSYASRNATADVWGESDPAVVTDVRKGYSTSMSILTKDEDEYQALLAAVNSSVVYIVGLERHRRRTGYYLVGDIAPQRLGLAESTYDTWSVALQGIGRPNSSGQSLTVPRRSYADRKARAPLYRDVTGQAPATGDPVTNLVWNPSVEGNLTNTQTYLSVTRADVNTDAFVGIDCVQHTQSATGLGGSSWTMDAAAAGQTVQAGIYVKLPSTGITDVRLIWRSGTTLLHSQTVTTPPTGLWQRVTGSYTLGAGEVCDRIGVACTAATGTVWLADAAMGELGATMHPYGDGDTEGWMWNGTGRASSSRRVRVYGAGTEPYSA